MLDELLTVYSFLRHSGQLTNHYALTPQNKHCSPGPVVVYDLTMAKRKDPAAVSLGRRGGLAGGRKGGKARMAMMTAEQRSELGRKAVMARWAKRKRKTR